MAPIKALLTGLVGFSLCMANISGIVTDTGTTPISGAVVRLENGGQSATTGADGRFTLVASNAILPVNGKLLPKGPSAQISGTMLNITVTERSAEEVVTFDLNGKLLSTVCRTMDAGSHSIALPQQGAGIYLYKVKTGNNKFVLKGNAVGGISYGNSVTTQGTSIKALTKQAKATAAINDVIAAIKTGYLNYRVIAYNSDTTGIQIKMIASAGTVTDADGNVYQTVKIGNQVWMAENLHVTTYNDGSPIPLAQNATSWSQGYNNGWSSEAFCYLNNTANSDSIKQFGALYNWFVVSTNKLAPSGWHVPDTVDWRILEDYLRNSGGNIAKRLSAKTNWKTSVNPGAVGNDLSQNNTTGFSALPGGGRDDLGGFYYPGCSSTWWCRNGSDISSQAFYRNLYYDFNYVTWAIQDKWLGCSVRLIKD